MNKREFREKIADDLLGSDVVVHIPGDTPMQAVNNGIIEGWLCKWPDCKQSEYACGTKYGCAMIPKE